MFYPVLVDTERCAVLGAGDPLPFEQEPDLSVKIKGLTAVWPIRTSGSYGNWGVGHSTLRRLIQDGYVALGAHDKKRNTWAISYLSQRLREQIETGVLEVVGFDKVKNCVDVKYSELGARRIKTVWKRSRHDAGAYGSDMITTLLGRTEAFPFPKSLYAVEDTLRLLVDKKPNAVILDFFAGSGTTFHATALMNARDGGKRQSILVTNNEVAEAQERKLAARNFFPGDDEFESFGICESATWPRCRNAITGQREDGAEIPGAYLGNFQDEDAILLKDGLKENLEYLRLDFVDSARVERGDAFETILPILWMVAGSVGTRDKSRGVSPWYVAEHSPLAVLIQEARFLDFREKLKRRNDITYIFLVTDSEENFIMMRKELGQRFLSVQLYKSYLENFRINTINPALTGEG